MLEMKRWNQNIRRRAKNVKTEDIKGWKETNIPKYSDVLRQECKFIRLIKDTDINWNYQGWIHVWLRQIFFLNFYLLPTSCDMTWMISPTLTLSIPWNNSGSVWMNMAR
jgi:hypothetical protein